MDMSDARGATKAALDAAKQAAAGASSLEAAQAEAECPVIIEQANIVRDDVAGAGAGPLQRAGWLGMMGGA